MAEKISGWLALVYIVTIICMTIIILGFLYFAAEMRIYGK